MKQAYPQVILASASSYKKDLLTRLKIEFSIVPANIDESIAKHEAPKQAALRLAREKALTVARQVSPQSCIIIGCDQVAYLDDDKNEPFLGKPGSTENAKKQLKRASGRNVHFFTAFYMLETASGEHREGCDETRVQYRKLSETDIDYYLDNENALDCAGSAKVEGLGISLLEEVSTKDPTALIGLPLIQVSQALTEMKNCKP